MHAQQAKVSECRGHIRKWLTTTTTKHGFVGSIGAVCTDGSVLPTVTYGYNGTYAPACPVNLEDLQVTRNENTFEYRSGLFSHEIIDLVFMQIQLSAQERADYVEDLERQMKPSQTDGIH